MKNIPHSNVSSLIQNKLDKRMIFSADNVNFSESRKKFNSYFGNMGEVIAQEVLSKEGFDVCRWSPMGGDGTKFTIYNSLGRCLRYLYPIEKERIITIDGVTYHTKTYFEEKPEKIIKQLKRFFGEKITNLKRYVDSLNIFPQPKTPLYIPDLVAKKDDEIYIVEVKTNSGTIYGKRQTTRLRALLSARQFDLTPLLIHFNLRLEATDLTAKKLNPIF
jgi:hypothetical protein